MNEDQKNIQEDELIEKGFNEALADLQKAMGSDSDGKSMKKKAATGGDDGDLDEDDFEEDEDDSEEDENQSYEKSISGILAEDPEAAVAMDVEPFLRQLVKAVDESVTILTNSVNKRLGEMSKLVKSQGKLLIQTAQLEKSTSDIVKRIGGQPIQSTSIKGLNKSRFETGGVSMEYDSMTILQKSREWVRLGKTDLTEAGIIESRVNKGTLGRHNDVIDQRVAQLMKEAV